MEDFINILITYKHNERIILNSVIKCEESISSSNFQILVENNLKKKHKDFMIIRFCSIDLTFNAEVDINFDDAFFVVNKQNFVIYLEKVG